MKLLPAPDLDPIEIYKACVNEISTAELVSRFTDSADEVLSLAQRYKARALARELHLFPASNWGQNEQVVLGELTKGEFMELYSSYFVNRNRPARLYYDRLMNSAPLGKCPFCEFGQVSTLDHFMGKAHYPCFSILPFNLVPACADCNKGKGPGIVSAGNQISHPYFETQEIETETWLYASLVETSPATATFSAIPPAHWPADLSTRVGNYFKDFSLASRFSIEAASELSSVSDFLGLLGRSEHIGVYLGRIAQVERMQRRNSWKAALYETLAGSAWYRDGGYKRPTT